MNPAFTPGRAKTASEKELFQNKYLKPMLDVQTFFTIGEHTIVQLHRSQTSVESATGAMLLAI